MHSKHSLMFNLTGLLTYNLKVMCKKSSPKTPAVTTTSLTADLRVFRFLAMIFGHSLVLSFSHCQCNLKLQPQAVDFWAQSLRLLRTGLELHYIASHTTSASARVTNTVTSFWSIVDRIVLFAVSRTSEPQESNNCRKHLMCSGSNHRACSAWIQAC
jgi:hypothetical protein